MIDLSVFSDAVPFIFGGIGVGLIALIYRQHVLLERQYADCARAHMYVKSLENKLYGEVPDLNELNDDVSFYTSTIKATESTNSIARLAGGLAHEFNNILSIIDGYARLAAKLDKSSPEFSSYLQKIQTAVERGTNITQKITVFSRHQSKTNAVIDLAHELNRNQAILLRDVPDTVKTTINLPSSPAPILTHNDAFMTIMSELINNALYAMPDGGLLNINLRTIDAKEVKLPDFQAKYDHYVKVSIQDTGHGIPRQHIQNIFDPFFTTDTSKAHSGMGLSTVYGLLKQLDGMISIRSQVGKGTLFELYFPQSDKECVKQVSGGASDPSSIHMQGYTALVVDDEPDLLMVTKSMLEDMGLNVLTASCGDEALLVQDLHDGVIDLLLTDFSMPGMTGIDLSEMLQTFHPNLHTICMSGFPAHNDKNIDHQNESRHATVFIQKPLCFDNLAILIHTQLTGTITEHPTSLNLWKEAGNA